MQYHITVSYSDKVEEFVVTDDELLLEYPEEYVVKVVFGADALLLETASAYIAPVHYVRGMVYREDKHCRCTKTICSNVSITIKEI